MIDRVWRTVKAAWGIAYEEWFAETIEAPVDEREAEIEAIASELHARGANGSSRAAAEALYDTQLTPKDIRRPEGQALWRLDRLVTSEAERTKRDDECIRRRLDYLQEEFMWLQDAMLSHVDMIHKRLDKFSKPSAEPKKETSQDAQR